MDKVDLCRRAIAVSNDLPLLHARELCDALLVQVATVHSKRVQKAEEEEEEPKTVEMILASFGRGFDAMDLIQQYCLGDLVSEDEVDGILEDVADQINHLEILTTDETFQGLDTLWFLENFTEISGQNAYTLRTQLARIAVYEEGKKAIERALDGVISDPYAHYRDQGLIALGAIVAVTPDVEWSQRILQQILKTGLDDEGVCFTFDLPLLLRAEAERRGLPVPESINAYCQEVLNINDRWGSSVRDRSAMVATTYFLDDKEKAEKILDSFSWDPGTIYAGYAAVHMLALANRWRQFGRLERVTSPPNKKPDLLEKAEESANHVIAHDFREERIQLVKAHRDEWWDPKGVPETHDGLAMLAPLTGDTRLALIDYLLAAWSNPPDDEPNIEGMKVLLLHALIHATTLDAVLARLC